MAAAAARARRLLAGAGPEGTGRWRDAVRLAAQRAAERILRRLARGTGRGPRDLRAAVRAWEAGGAAALEVLEDAGGPVPERPLWQLAAAWRDTPARPALRGRRRWWPYRKEGGRRWPAGPAASDPATALSAALDDAPGGAEPR
ncbi:hypothetical protein [Streptomyces sp. 7-21]|uniref:hypothetical protein n=1 Tax=Streptomyces sp. 7-21 TaxID=2802283 RepID=UPI001F21170D|nr:hypothetical protein [Streptomyces sp. 7-21]